MKTLVLGPGCAFCGALRGKLLWMRVNRVLAWALVVSPVLQFASRTPFLRGLAIDLAILLAHGALSLALFGLPRLEGRIPWLILSGFQPEGLSPRNRFLMKGWGIALPFIYASTLWCAAPITLLFLPVLVWSATLLPVRLVEHVYLASEQAMRRWRFGDADSQAAMVVVVFMGLHFANLVRLAMGR